MPTPTRETRRLLEFLHTWLEVTSHVVGTERRCSTDILDQINEIAATKWNSSGGDLPETKAVGSMADIIPHLGKGMQAAVRIKNAFAYLSDIRISLYITSLTIKSEDVMAPPFARTIGKQTLNHLLQMNAFVQQELLEKLGLDIPRLVKVIEKLSNRSWSRHQALHRRATYFVSKPKEGQSE